MSRPHRTHTDPRDHLILAGEVNTTPYYVIHSVFRTAGPLHNPDTAVAEKAVLGTGVNIRGQCNIGGSRADADLMLWTLASDSHSLQAACRTLHDSGLGRSPKPVWSCIGMYRPVEFNRDHTLACSPDAAPRPWAYVYPSVYSYERYYTDEEHRSKMLTAHGRMDREYSDVPGSTISAFALNGYEWLPAFETDELHHLTDAVRYQHGAETRPYMHKGIPFFTGPRVILKEWACRQPRS